MLQVGNFRREVARWLNAFCPIDRAVGLCPTDILDDRQKFRGVLNEYERQFPDDPPDQVRLVQLVQQLHAANELEPGDYIELGTLLGMTLKVIHQYMDPDRTLYSFDTFTGFDQRDVDDEKAIYSNKWRQGNFRATSPEYVAHYLGRPENLRLIPGWFPETFDGYHHLLWRFAHIDMDLYQPTLIALLLLWPRMVPGGIIMIHDYGCTSFRAKLAVDHFCKGVGVAPVALADRFSTAIIRRPWA